MILEILVALFVGFRFGLHGGGGGFLATLGGGFLRLRNGGGARLRLLLSFLRRFRLRLILVLRVTHRVKPDSLGMAHTNNRNGEESGGKISHRVYLLSD